MLSKGEKSWEQEKKIPSGREERKKIIIIHNQTSNTHRSHSYRDITNSKLAITLHIKLLQLSSFKQRHQQLSASFRTMRSKWRCKKERKKNWNLIQISWFFNMCKRCVKITMLSGIRMDNNAKLNVFFFFLLSLALLCMHYILLIWIL